MSTKIYWMRMSEDESMLQSHFSVLHVTMVKLTLVHLLLLAENVTPDEIQGHKVRHLSLRLVGELLRSDTGVPDQQNTVALCVGH